MPLFHTNALTAVNHNIIVPVLSRFWTNASKVTLFSRCPGQLRPASVLLSNVSWCTSWHTSRGHMKTYTKSGGELCSSKQGTDRLTTLFLLPNLTKSMRCFNLKITSEILIVILALAFLYLWFYICLFSKNVKWFCWPWLQSRSPRGWVGPSGAFPFQAMEPHY